MTLHSHAWAIALACGLLACGGDDDDGGGGGGAGGGGTPESYTDISVSVLEVAEGVAPSQFEPLPDVELCTFERTALPCTQTDALGEATVQVLASGDTGFTMRKAGYFSALAPFETPISGSFRYGLYADALISPVMPPLGIIYPDTEHGAVFVLARDRVSHTASGVAGVSFTLSATSAQGPLYSDATGAPTTGLTETGEAGGASFWTVPPGEYTLSASHATLDCARVEGWPAGTAAEMRIPVQANASTVVSFACQ